jgi:hypothetical protein
MTVGFVLPLESFSNKLEKSTDSRGSLHPTNPSLEYRLAGSTILLPHL